MADSDDDLIELVLDDAGDKMDKAVTHTRHEFSTVRTGRASSALVEKLPVEAYGAEVPEVDFRPYFGGAQAATMPLANDTVFSLEAFKSLLHVFAPEALTDRLETRRSVRPRIQRDDDLPIPGVPGRLH